MRIGVAQLRSGLEERALDPLDCRDIALRQRKPMPPDEAPGDLANVAVEQCPVRCGALIPVHEAANSRRAHGRRRSRKQARQKLRPRRRQLDHCFVHQVQQHVLTPDVDDERHPRFQRRDIGEVLIGSDSEIHTARYGRPSQLGHDALKRALVRDEVV